MNLMYSDIFKSVDTIPGYTPVGFVYGKHSLDKILYNYSIHGYMTQVKSDIQNKHIIYIKI